MGWRNKSIKHSRIAGTIAAIAFAATAGAAMAKPSHHASLAAALDAASTDNSLIMVVFSADWCAPCKLLKKETLAATEFTDKAGALRIVEINIDVDQKTTRTFNVSAIPTLLLITAESKIASRRTGYLNPADLLKWLDEGRQRVSRGEWEGTATGGETAKLVDKLNAAEIGTNELARLIHLVGDPDPSERTLAGRFLLSQREQAVPPLIEALGDSYVGVRIAAGELLQRLSGDAPLPDPWAAPDEQSVAKMKEWWARTGKLPPADAQPTLTPALKASINTALDWLRGKDPAQRTEAMSSLVSQGTVALPAIRAAIKQAEAKGDPRTLALLEDVRWAILIPDGLERRAGGVRQALARGTSQERQVAADRLARQGREAIPALAELVNDADPLVIENAVRALSTIGGRDSIPAMAALLTAADSNLRMTAAQALGKTKNLEAAKLLLPVLSDPDEIVACTAIAALEEVHARENSSSNETASPEVAAALEKALGDSRWRVRASAAEAAGKMRLSALASALRKLLEDDDGFVVKKTLAALSALSAAPTTEKLAAIAKRLPALRGDAVEMLIESASEEAIKTVTNVYDSGNTEERVAVLHALARAEGRGNKNSEDPWKPLLQKAITAEEAPVRRAAAQLLAMCPIKTAAELVGPLLDDSDLETRAAAAEVVLCVVAGKRRVPSRGGVAGVHFTSEDAGVSVRGKSEKTKTNAVYASAEELSGWHATLMKHAASTADIRVAVAAYVTGDGRAGLDSAMAAFKKLAPSELKRLVSPITIPAIMGKLPWPDGKPLLEAMSASPGLFAAAAHDSNTSPPAVADWLLDPQRFTAAVEKAAGQELAGILQVLLENDRYGEGRGKWNLLSGDRALAIVDSLVKSRNPGWRAAAIYALGQREPATRTNIFEGALTDPSPWVRAVGVQGLAAAIKERPVLEERIGTLLFDTNKYVAQITAAALLEEEIRNAANLDWTFRNFTFETTAITTASITSQVDDRPLTTLEHKPAFLQQLRTRLESTGNDELPMIALLLAQYGTFDGMERLAAEVLNRPPSKKFDPLMSSANEALLTTIALSRDTKYLPVVRRIMDTGLQSYELQKVLKALRGMTGPEVRQLRLDVNKRMRQNTTQVSGE